ncbi:Rid family hydrolase [Streptomyces hawaiiensis]
MSKPEFFVTPGYGEKKLALHHYTQAVKIDNRVEIAGQGGWNDDDEYPEAIADEIARAFENVERTLALTGATWDHVIHVNSYHLPMDGEALEGDGREVPALHARPGADLDVHRSPGPG